MFANGFLTFSKVVGKVVAALLPDLLLLGGAASVIWGVRLMSVPSSFIVGGVIAILLGVIAVRKK